MNSNTAFNGAMAGVGLSLTGLALSVTEITAILSLVSTGLGLLIMIATAIIIPIYKWYKKSKEDGKIDPEELEEAIEIIKSGSDALKPEVKEAIEKIEKIKDKD